MITMHENFKQNLKPGASGKVAGRKGVRGELKRRRKMRKNFNKITKKAILLLRN